MTRWYKPENDGLVFVAEKDLAGSYEFNIFRVYYQPESDRFYWGIDSGCSCPIPFEGFQSLGDYRDGNLYDTLRAIDTWAGTSFLQGYHGEIVDFKKYISQWRSKEYA